MITYAGIDGTCPEDDKSYEKTYLNSFINRLKRNELVRFSDCWYLRGPFVSGRDTYGRALECYKYVHNLWRFGKSKAIFLGGHSRGAAAVIEVAKWLDDENIPVECLIIFDAVDRTYTLGGTVWNTPIPKNVKRVIYAQRDVFRARSRLSFGNCGLTYGAATTFFHKKFFATHSGVGGLPWPKSVLPSTDIPNPTGYIWEPAELLSSFVTPAADASGSQEVWSWASSHIAFAYQLCADRLKSGSGVSPAPDFQTPNQPNAPRMGGKQRIHVVVAGDWLSKIALKYYGDAMKYPIIHMANLDQIGSSPDLIKPGQRLIIP